jgi:hypothetical protein
MWIHILISCSGSERWSASSSLWVLLCGGTMSVIQWWNVTMAHEWSSDGVVLWLGGCKIETQLSDEKTDQGWDDLFVAVEGESRTVWGG